MKTRAFMVIAATCGTCLDAGAQVESLRYRIQHFNPGPGLEFWPGRLNNAGQIGGAMRGTGCRYEYAQQAAIREFNGTFRLSPACMTKGLAINDDGVLIGGSLATQPWDSVSGCLGFDAMLVPFVPRNNTSDSFGFATIFYLHAISGQYSVGTSWNRNGGGGWMLLPDGRFRDLPFPPVDVNSRGHLLDSGGGILLPSGITRSGALIPGTCSSGAVDLSEVDGVLLGASVPGQTSNCSCWYCPTGFGSAAAVLWPSGVLMNIPELPGHGMFVSAKRMNDSYTVVGSDTTELCPGCSGETHAFLFNPAFGTLDLHAIVNRQGSSAVVSDAKDINNWGMILAVVGGVNCALIPDVPCVIAIAQPEHSCATAGQSVTITAAFASPTPLTFQWYKDGVPLIDGDGVFGSRLPSVTIDAMAVRHVGSYFCTATAACGSVSTAAASLRLPGTLAIVQQPQSQAVASTGSVTFSVDAVRNNSCATPVQYVWQRRDQRVSDENASGAWIDLNDGGGFVNTRTQALTLLQALPGLTGPYRCRITDPCGCDPIHSDPVDFSVACPSDFNGDGGIDFGDVEAVFERWESGC